MATLEDQLEKFRKGQTAKGHLNLRQLALQELPHAVYSFTGHPITTLNLAGNHLAEIPKEIARLHSLCTLILSNNRIKSIPLDLDLPNLESLQLDNNEIEVIPREIDRLVSLEELVLDNNRISQIPDNLHSGHMKALSYLVLEHNPLSPADIPISVLTDSSLHIILKMETMVEVFDGVFQGNQSHELNLALLQRNKITHVIGLNEKTGPSHSEHLEYINIDLMDRLDQAIEPHLERLIDFISTARSIGGKCLVHCCAGISRSGAIVVAYVMKTQKVSFEEALLSIRQRRPACRPNQSFVKQLKEWHANL